MFSHILCLIYARNIIIIIIIIPVLNGVKSMRSVLICSLFDLCRKANADNHALSDASKKRLMEDTEDWHPKTGTSQSRSFRILAQLTGTENGACQLRSPMALSAMFIAKLWKIFGSLWMT